MNNGTLTHKEADNLCRIIRQREKLAKTMAKERSASLKAKVEEQLNAIYSFDQDETWESAHDAAEKVVEEARRTVAERCKELGIPARFAPDLHLGWYSRGENELDRRFLPGWSSWPMRRNLTSTSKFALIVHRIWSISGCASMLRVWSTSCT